MTPTRMALRNSGAVLLWLGICFSPLQTAAEEGIADLKRAIEQLQAQNRELTRRLNALENRSSEPKQVARREPAPKPARVERTQRAEQRQAPPSSEQAAAPPTRAEPSPNLSLEERVNQLELAKSAQESAVRSIIQSTFSTIGPKINEFVSLGGSLEITAGRGSDFSGHSSDQISVSTAELDLEIRANEWMTGNLTVAYESPTSTLFPTNPSFNTAGVDRFTLDKGYVTIGDTLKFPLYARTGLDYLPFGISTGSHRNDVLSIVNPLTIEAFEMRKPMIGIGFGLPTPAPAPPPAPIIVPPVQPMVLSPLVSAFARRLGYQPPLRPKPPSPYTPSPEPPPFYGFIDLYDSSAPDVPNRRVTGNINGRLGYHTGGHCGLPYSELQSSYLCPWGIEANLDYDSSVFDSRFLQSEYLPFLGQIGQIPGLAATVKLNFGPFLLIGEWNSALRPAKFTDGAGNRIQITPSAWQVALGYQFGWNPWVETIGAQGDYVAVGYSRTSDLPGVAPPAGTTSGKVGALPQGRLSVTAGEWFLENAKLAIEYSHNWDYPVSKGGTGRQSDGVFTALTYNW
jgi:uncharacterized coiled-coil protein SlyX